MTALLQRDLRLPPESRWAKGGPTKAYTLELERKLMHAIASFQDERAARILAEAQVVKLKSELAKRKDRP